MAKEKKDGCGTIFVVVMVVMLLAETCTNRDKIKALEKRVNRLETHERRSDQK